MIGHSSFIRIRSSTQFITRSTLTSSFILAILPLLALMTACAPNPPANRSGLQAATPVPTLNTTDPEALCSAVETAWDSDWPTAIRALEALKTLQAACDDATPAEQRLYTAYYAYGMLLEQRNRRDEAIQAYESALLENPSGAEAADALRRLNVYTPAPPEGCDPDEVSRALAAVPNYTPSAGSFVGIEGQHLVLDGKVFPVYGVNYYPRDTPWRRFLTETRIESVNPELELIQGAGINTLRIFVWHEPLFTCPGNGAVPAAETFARLDAIIQAAAARGFRLIVTLNDLPDLSVYPLYDSPRHVVEQMAYIVRRYRDEPAILAWDLRNAGDLDYLEGAFERAAVLEWLTRTAILVRRADPNHLITASWRREAEASIPAVDFVSFQHFDDVGWLRQRIAELRAQTDKPILLSAVGYSTFQMDDIAQRDALQQALDAAKNNDLAGWVVWTAFDYPLTVTCTEPDCPSADSADHHFGLWNTSYFPKLSVDVIQLMTHSS